MTSQTPPLGSLGFTGLEHAGGARQSPGYSITAHHADVTFEADVASVDVNPMGGRT